MTNNVFLISYFLTYSSVGLLSYECLRSSDVLILADYSGSARGLIFLSDVNEKNKVRSIKSVSWAGSIKVAIIRATSADVIIDTSCAVEVMAEAPSCS